MAVPVYTRIVESIKEKISSGELKPGDAIDSENTLCKEFGASRMTVRKGLAILARDGYIYSIPGKGNFVKKPDLTRYTIYYDEMSNSINKVDKTQLLEVSIIMPDEKLADSLQTTRRKNLIAIRRLFFTDGNPVAYDVKYLLYHRGMPIVEKELQYATFSEILSKATPAFTLKKELTIYAQMPDDDIKYYLNIYDQLPLLVVEQKLFGKDNKPMGLGVTYYRSDYIKLQGTNQ
ncbi:MAG: GntR family transcriptional regulator [Firmicutes bacterium]|jgi:GntR family transcriptional regulator|nr:GntR family transcriptional regulator [Bacillota bacterium]